MVWQWSRTVTERAAAASSTSWQVDTVQPSIRDSEPRDVRQAVASAPVSQQPSTPLDRRRWIALVIVLVAGFMDLLDTTIVNVAIPSIQRDLQAQYAQLEWIVAGYVLAFAVVLITSGRLGDIYGRRRLFLTGVAGFTIASALCGIACSPGMLIVSRFLQGGTAGLMVPQILAIIHVTFPLNERGRVFGIFGAIVGSAAVVGPTVGGVLVDWNVFGLDWRPIFLVNVPVGIGAIAAGLFVMRESKSATTPKLDLVGAGLVTAAIAMLVYPLTEGRRFGWPAWTFAMMAGAVAVLAVLVVYEHRRARTIGSPLVVLGLFRARSFTIGSVLWLIFWIALGGFFLIWTLYMQLGLGWSPLRAGLTSGAFAVGAAAAAGISVEVLVPRYGRRVLMAGALLNATGFASCVWAAGRYGPAITSWQLIAPLAISGLGFGLIVSPTVDFVLAAVPKDDAGSASGLLNTAQQLGVALGVALVGVIFFTQLDSGSDRGVDTVVPRVRTELAAAGLDEQAQARTISGFRVCMQDRSASTNPTETPISCRGIQGQATQPGRPDRVTEILSDAGEKANAENFSRTFGRTLWWAVGILAAVFVGLFAVPRQAGQHSPNRPGFDAHRGAPPVG
ncbi:MFS transporter [Nocardia sp. NBC_00565]|uniref:MFS transporter n=1 Tax=Nocardia sp. NBC_00565 TaxID=2975993 RepID=UPI002E7FD85D|nr:MFS transporter [Nocardia sp. NBC_00565]WUC07568.1 MFS transporter [Nocardia sp. NBC_00565]